MLRVRVGLDWWISSLQYGFVSQPNENPGKHLVQPGPVICQVLAGSQLLNVLDLPTTKVCATPTTSLPLELESKPLGTSGPGRRSSEVKKVGPPPNPLHPQPKQSFQYLLKMSTKALEQVHQLQLPSSASWSFDCGEVKETSENVDHLPVLLLQRFHSHCDIRFHHADSGSKKSQIK